LNIILPTAEIINIGEEVEHRQDALTLSVEEIIFFSLKSLTIFAPTGYPHKTLIKKAYPTCPPTPKSFVVIGESSLEILLVTDNAESMAVIKK
jgi:hypothetical protein